MEKIIIITSLIFLFLGTLQTCQAAGLLLDYPEIGGIKPGTGQGETTDLPQIIKYIYLFALSAVGVVALLSMLIGAVKYVLSAGNPSKASDAKDQIFSAILGIILLLASVMILRTINPDLVNIGFALPAISRGGEGTVADYGCYCCCVRSAAGRCDPFAVNRLACYPNTTQSTALTKCEGACKIQCIDYVTSPLYDRRQAVRAESCQ